MVMCARASGFPACLANFCFYRGLYNPRAVSLCFISYPLYQMVKELVTAYLLADLDSGGNGKAATACLPSLRARLLFSSSILASILFARKSWPIRRYPFLGEFGLCGICLWIPVNYIFNLSCIGL